MSHGGRNLILLGIFSILIALITSGISLALYHNSGDIYLDRSRPGFLPDDNELNESEDINFSFSDSGDDISSSELEEYLEQLREVQRKIDAIPDPYSAESLSDESLNILAK